MSKFDAITNESGRIKTFDKVLSIYPTLEAAPENKFTELVNGKVRLEFNNFKDPQNVYTKYYMELKDVRYLYEKIRICHMPDPVSFMKITGKSPMTEGPYRGKCWTATMTITRQTKSATGEVMRNPWKIEIRNGYAIAIKQKSGGFRADMKSFTITSKEEMRLSDADMLYLFGSAVDYITAYQMVVAQTLIPKGESALKKARQNSNYKGQAYTSDTYRGYTQNVEEGEALPYESENQKDMNVYPEREQTEQSPKEEETTEENKTTVAWHHVEIGFKSDFIPLNNGVMVAKCYVAPNTDKEWEIRFKNPSQKITDACNKKISIGIEITKGPDGKFWARTA